VELYHVDGSAKTITTSTFNDETTSMMITDKSQVEFHCVNGRVLM
jgi:hypothetical protein